jgi:hypothetical protein
MQKYLNKLTFENINFLISRLGQNIAILMVDIYGNYFCQRLIQICSSEQRTMVLSNVDILNIDCE